MIKNAMQAFYSNTMFNKTIMFLWRGRRGWRLMKQKVELNPITSKAVCVEIVTYLYSYNAYVAKPWRNEIIVWQKKKVSTHHRKVKKMS